MSRVRRKSSKLTSDFCKTRVIFANSNEYTIMVDIYVELTLVFCCFRDKLGKKAEQKGIKRCYLISS